MEISIYQSEPQEEPTCPFGGRFDTDPWIAFHGSSSVNEHAIMADGLFAGEQGYTRTDLAALCSIFESLWWVGESVNGYAVLKAFSDADYMRGDGVSKPTHLAESSFRAMRYALPSRAGGEAAMAVREAFADLDKALATPEGVQAIRDAAFKQLRGGLRPPYPDGCAPTPGFPVEFRHIHAFWSWRLTREPQLENLRPLDVTSDWPRAELERLRARLATCFAAAGKWQYGVVYAIRLDETFLPYLSYTGSNGLCCVRRIPPQRIVAKAILPRSTIDGINFLSLGLLATPVNLARSKFPIFDRAIRS